MRGFSGGKSWDIGEDLRVLKYKLSIRKGEGCQGLKSELKAWPKLYAGQEP